MKAKSIKGKSTEAIEAALASSMADGFEPKLAIIFSRSNKTGKELSMCYNQKALMFWEQLQRGFYRRPSGRGIDCHFAIGSKPKALYHSF